MDPSAKYAAQIASRLAALPSGGLRNDPQELAALESLALRLLEELSAARKIANRPTGETSGMWRAMQPIQKR